METRELEKQKHEAQMQEWSARISVMKAQTEKLTAQAKIDMQGQLEAVREKYAFAKTKVNESWTAAEDRWSILVQEADDAWKDLGTAAKAVYESVTTHDKH